MTRAVAIAPAPVIADPFEQLAAMLSRHWRPAFKMAATLVPLLILLVGSCDMTKMPLGAQDANAAAFRAALFPKGVDNPEQGYILRAQKLVIANPPALLLLQDADIRNTLGAPAMERKDADARIWQYRAGGCVMDVYFYGAKPRYADVRMDGDSLPAAEQGECLRRIAAAQK